MMTKHDVVKSVLIRIDRFEEMRRNSAPDYYEAVAGQHYYYFKLGLMETCQIMVAGEHTLSDEAMFILED